MAAAVILDLVLVRCIWSDLGDRIFPSLGICKLILGTSFVFLVATTVLVPKYSGPGIDTIRIGSRILLVIVVLGLLVIIWAST
jgi:hypothetical protein